MATPKKIVLLGFFGVGKTSLIRQFVESDFSEDYLVTVGVHVKKKDIIVKDETVTLIIWDVEGNTSVEKARSSYLLGSKGFIYVFDVTRPETFEEIASEMAFLNKNYPNIPVKLVGNKIDLAEAYLKEKIFHTSEFEDCVFTSAKTGLNVEEMFLQLTQKML